MRFRKIGDLVAVVVREDPASDGFEMMLATLERLVEYHAGLEEHQMFKQAASLGRERLIELGHILRRRQDGLRRSLPHRIWRGMKWHLAKLSSN